VSNTDLVKRMNALEKRMKALEAALKIAEDRNTAARAAASTALYMANKK